MNRLDLSHSLSRSPGLLQPHRIMRQQRVPGGSLCHLQVESSLQGSGSEPPASRCTQSGRVGGQAWNAWGWGAISSSHTS